MESSWLDGYCCRFCGREYDETDLPEDCDADCPKFECSEA